MRASEEKQLQEDEWFGGATHLWTIGAGGEDLYISFMINYVISDW